MAGGFPGEGGDFDQRRRRFRDRYGASDDAWGASDAEDHYDDGTSADMSLGDHAAGLDYDTTYEQNYGYDQPYAPPPQQVVPPDSRDGQAIQRAQQLRDRLESRKREIGQYGSRSRATSSDGIDRFFDAKPSTRSLPCPASVVLVFLFVGMLVVCVMAILAVGSLQRLLGL